MANIQNFQFLRNGSLYSSKADAVAALNSSAVKDKALDGSIIFARYQEGSDPVKTIYALYYVNGGTTTATIYDTDSADLTAKIAAAEAAAKAYASGYTDTEIGELAVPTISGVGQFIYAVGEEDGKVSASAKTVEASEVSFTPTGAVTSNTVQAAIEQVAASAGGDLAAEIEARQRVDGITGSAYTANASAAYISGATSLNDADVKLNNALAQEVSDRAAAITAAIQALDVTAITAGDGAFIKSVSEADGKISATTADMPTVSVVTEAGKPIVAVSQSKGTVAASAGTINAEYVNVADTAGVFTAGNVETVLKELYDDVQAAKSATTLSAADKSVVVATAETGTTVKVNIKSGEQVIKLDTTDGIYTNVSLSSITPSSTTVKEEYALMSDGAQLGSSIKIYKDSSLVKIELVNEDPTQTPAKQGQFLKYTYIDASGVTNSVYVDVSALLVEAEFQSGVTATSAGIVRGVVDSTSEGFLTVGANGFKLDGVQDAIDNAVGTAISGLDATVTSTSGTFVDVTVDEKDGKITAVTVTEDNIAAADKLTDLSGKAVTFVAMSGGTVSTATTTDGTVGVSINTDGSQIDLTGYAGNTRQKPGIFSGSQLTTVAATDSVNGAFDKIEDIIIEDEGIINTEIANIKAAIATNKVVAGNGIAVATVEGGTQVSAKAATNSGENITNPITVDGDGIKFATSLDAGTY